jgi:basic membrane protein A and related proteins
MRILLSAKTPRLLLILIIVASGLPFLSGCAGNTPQKVLNIGVMLGSSGLGDRSFNDSAYEGLLQAKKELNINFEIATPTTDKDSNLETMRIWARGGFDLIIGIAFENLEVIRTVALEFPEVNFGAVDFELGAHNVSSIVFREQEADFLMGVLCAMLTKTKSVGVIGGTDIPAIRRIFAGFNQGVSYQDPGVKVIADFAGTFADPQVGYNLAMKRYNEGVDVIHNAASKTGLGIIEAAKASGKLTTGTSGDQRYLAPGYVVGNRPKRVDTAVMLLVREVKDNRFTSGIRSLGLKESGLSLGPFDPDLVTPAMMSRLDELKGRIVSGEITVRSE